MNWPWYIYLLQPVRPEMNSSVYNTSVFTKNWNCLAVLWYQYNKYNWSFVFKRMTQTQTLLRCKLVSGSHRNVLIKLLIIIIIIKLFSCCIFKHQNSKCCTNSQCLNYLTSNTDFYKWLQGHQNERTQLVFWQPVQKERHSYNWFSKKTGIVFYSRTRSQIVAVNFQPQR